MINQNNSGFLGEQENGSFSVSSKGPSINYVGIGEGQNLQSIADGFSGGRGGKNSYAILGGYKVKNC